MLLTNARIYTMDAVGSVADSLVVREGRIAFCGRRADVNPSAGEPIVDLHGHAVLPGLVDAHGHLMHLARARFTFDASGRTSEEAIARRVGETAARRARGEWIAGRGWDQNLWPGMAFPSRASLDRVAPDHPVALVRVDGHATWANSAALRAAGIDRHTPDPSGGTIARDARGEATGLLVDTAQRLVAQVQPPPDEARFDQAVREAIAQCLAAGLTGLHEMGADLRALAAYRRLVERGQFPLRNYVAVAGREPEAWARYREHGPESIGDGRVEVRALKLMADGALGSRGAALHHPYCDDPENSGLVLLPSDELYRLTAEAAARGFQVCVHAIGDRANTMVLDAFERVLAERPAARTLRHRVEHAQILAERDIGRFARLGVLPSMQATHCTSDMPWAEARLGPDRLRGAYAWRSLLDTGVRIAGGSDFPVEDPNPFHGIYAAVARRPRTGEDRGWQPEQRMTRDEAVRSFTAWNAEASGQERLAGTLEVGKRADLVALSDDVFTCPESAIKDIMPRLTVLAGKIVYESQA
ncbi:MAG TPA: amidohydrolase [Verrucomicrobiae bacterium]|jgi:predicted amidohydrolase YtcJ|nr:amidohydrolase [Verrucomicrobiae bacterium]